MIEATTFKGQTLAVFGLGRSGISTALSLMAGGATVHAWDDRESSRDAAREQGVTIEDISQTDWSQYTSLVLSPGVPDTLPEPHWSAEKAKAANVPIICDIEIFACEVAALPENVRPKIVAITGTNGKSTTTMLVGHILESCGRDAQVGGNIGRGVLDLEPMHAGAYYVLELSSYQLERTSSLRANAAIFLNLSPDHLDRHGNMAGYEKAKSRIFLNQTKKDAVIIGVDNPEGQRLCTKLVAKNGRSIIPISGRKSLGRGVSVLKGKLYCGIDHSVSEVADLSQAEALEGVHNWQNAAAAYAAIRSLGLDEKSIAKGLLSFPGLAHRMENVGSVGPVRYVNDSKATNADAARQALKSYDNIYWIAGGQAKDGGIETLSDVFPNIAKAYLIGEAAPKFMKTLKQHGVEYKISGEMEMAVLCATKDALASKQPNPIILLSPACASFDQFEDFEKRGDAFKALAKDVINMFEREKRNRREEVARPVAGESVA